MRVKDLLKKLETVNPELELVYSFGDHEYGKIRTAKVVIAERDYASYYEYHSDIARGDEVTEPVFLIDGG